MLTLNCTNCNREIKIPEEEAYVSPMISEFILCELCEHEAVLERALSYAENEELRNLYFND